MNNYRILLTIAFLQCFFSCSLDDKNYNIEFSGSRIVKKADALGLLIDQDTINIDLNPVDSVYYSSLTFLNSNDSILCIESIKTKNNIPIKSNIVLLDQFGVKEKMLVENPKGIFVWDYYLSPGDKYLMYEIYHNDNSQDVGDFFNLPLDLYIIDFISLDTLDIIYSFHQKNKIDFGRYPWNDDATSIVYSLKGDIDRSGMYIYDLKEKKHRKIHSNGMNANWIGKDKIVYINNENAIKELNLMNNEITSIYKSDANMINILKTLNNEFLVITEIFENEFLYTLKRHEVFINLEDYKKYEIEKTLFEIQTETIKGIIRMENK